MNNETREKVLAFCKNRYGDRKFSENDLEILAIKLKKFGLLNKKEEVPVEPTKEPEVKKPNPREELDGEYARQKHTFELLKFQNRRVNDKICKEIEDELNISLDDYDKLDNKTLYKINALYQKKADAIEPVAAPTHTASSPAEGEKRRREAEEHSRDLASRMRKLNGDPDKKYLDVIQQLFTNFLEFKVSDLDKLEEVNKRLNFYIDAEKDASRQNQMYIRPDLLNKIIATVDSSYVSSLNKSIKKVLKTITFTTEKGKEIKELGDKVNDKQSLENWYNEIRENTDDLSVNEKTDIANKLGLDWRIAYGILGGQGESVEAILSPVVNALTKLKEIIVDYKAIDSSDVKEILKYLFNNDNKYYDLVKKDYSDVELGSKLNKKSLKPDVVLGSARGWANSLAKTKKFSESDISYTPTTVTIDDSTIEFVEAEEFTNFAFIYRDKDNSVIVKKYQPNIKVSDSLPSKFKDFKYLTREDAERLGKQKDSDDLVYKQKDDKIKELRNLQSIKVTTPKGETTIKVEPSLTREDLIKKILDTLKAGLSESLTEANISPEEYAELDTLTGENSNLTNTRYIVNFKDGTFKNETPSAEENNFKGSRKLVTDEIKYKVMQKRYNGGLKTKVFRTDAQKRELDREEEKRKEETDKILANKRQKLDDEKQMKVDAKMKARASEVEARKKEAEKRMSLPKDQR
jgi:hypothetical protein